MTGTNGANGANVSQEEARSALKALLASSRAYEISNLNDKVNGVESDGGLRRMMRADISRALRPPAARASLIADLESQVNLLLSRTPAPTLPPPAAPKPAPPAALEEVGLSDDDSASSAGAPEQEELQEEVNEPPRTLRLVKVEDSAAPLREHVTQARHLLHDLDGEVTQLTAQLRRSRQNAWALQQQQSATEARIRQALALRVSELDPKVVAEEKELEAEERTLRQELSEVKDRLQHLYAEAKHQDTILQQELHAQKGGDAHRIIARHPAGEVFLPAFPSDGDSDEEYDEAPPRRPAPPPAAAARGGASEDSSDESERQYRRPNIPTGGVGVQPAKRVAKVEESDDSEKYDSDSDGAQSPANGSGSLSRSATLDKSAGDAAAQSGSSVSRTTPTGTRLTPLTSTAAMRGAASGSSSDEDDAPAFKTPAPAPAAAKANGVPPVPLVQQQRPPLRGGEDEVEEVSSEEIEEELNSSRSL